MGPANADAAGAWVQRVDSHEKSLIDRETVFTAMRQITVDCPKYVLDLG
jgi:hypothetical protein